MNKLKTVSGDRRLVRVQKPSSSGAPAWMICAETQADAIASRSATTTANAAGRAATTDQVAEGLAVTNVRGEVSDVVRQLAWSICNANLNGAYGADPNGYARRMDKLQHDAMIVLAMRSASADDPTVRANINAFISPILLVPVSPPEVMPTPAAIQAASPQIEQQLEGEKKK
ncbi:hypothetical protein J4558_01025 [Leptolyngbya sp. 15MV]|nr:hypothetical protein J4558_01025 [Leptolyngbya sp. 15MV]